jgi:titin
MTIAWQPPHSDGGAHITGYIVEKRDTQALTGWMRVDRVRSHIYSYTITHLQEGHRYMFRVIAENSVGRSNALETRSPAEAKSPYRKFCLGWTHNYYFELKLKMVILIFNHRVHSKQM